MGVKVVMVGAGVTNVKYEAEVAVPLDAFTVILTVPGVVRAVCAVILVALVTL